MRLEIVFCAKVTLIGFSFITTFSYIYIFGFDNPQIFSNAELFSVESCRISQGELIFSYEGITF